MLNRRVALAFAACGASVLLLSAGCGGSIIVVGDGGAYGAGGGDDGGGSSGGQQTGDDTTGSITGSSGGTAGPGTGNSSGANPIIVDPCPTDIPTPGTVCPEPGHGCAYVTTDTTGTTSCYPVLCDPTGHWQASTTGCQ